MGSVTSPVMGSESRLRLREVRICLALALHAFPRNDQRLGSPTLLRPSIAQTRSGRYRTMNRLCIDYAVRPRLSSRLTLGGRALPRNPEAFGGGDSHPSFATHASILTRARSSSAHASPSRHARRSPTAR
jgi:hypothetical protein